MGLCLRYQVPAYNAEKTVGRAIDSVLAQTYSEIEIIIVNDGSTDNTWRVLRRYQQKHPQKIKIFSQKNKGLGATRNVLLEKAVGDYIINLDADDWLKEDYIERILGVVDDGDIMIGGFEKYNIQYRPCGKVIPPLGPYAKYRMFATAGKMFRTDFLRAHHLKYDSEFGMGEDAFFHTIAYSKTNKIRFLRYDGHCYLTHGNNQSMTHLAKYKEKYSYFSVVKAIVSNLNGSKMLYEREFHFFILFKLLEDIIAYRKDLSFRDLIVIYRRSIKWYRDFLKQYGGKFHVRFQKGESLINNLLVNCFIISSKMHFDSILIRVVKFLSML